MPRCLPLEEYDEHCKSYRECGTPIVQGRVGLLCLPGGDLQLLPCSYREECHVVFCLEFLEGRDLGAFHLYWVW